MLVGTQNGSMAIPRNPGRVKNVNRTRHFCSKLATVTESSQVLSSSQSLYPVGSQYIGQTLRFQASELHTNAQEWIQKHDKYRVDELECFVTLQTSLKGSGNVDKTLPVEVYFYEDTDADPSTLTSWIRTADRSNLGRVVLNTFHPSARLIKFRPTISNSADGDVQDPSNIIPPKGTWLDALALNQLHSGVRVYAMCPATDSSGQSYAFKLNFTWRAKITAKEPL